LRKPQTTEKHEGEPGIEIVPRARCYPEVIHVNASSLLAPVFPRGAALPPVTPHYVQVRRRGGVGFSVEDPGDCGRAIEEFLAAPGPAILQAAVDPFEPPMPAKVKAEQAPHFAESLARGEPNRKKIALTTISDQVRELI
jgi:hypothetical protein